MYVGPDRFVIHDAFLSVFWWTYCYNKYGQEHTFSSRRCDHFKPSSVLVWAKTECLSPHQYITDDEAVQSNIKKMYATVAHSLSTLDNQTRKRSPENFYFAPWCPKKEWLLRSTQLGTSWRTVSLTKWGFDPKRARQMVWSSFQLKWYRSVWNYRQLIATFIHQWMFLLYLKHSLYFQLSY